MKHSVLWLFEGLLDFLKYIFSHSSLKIFSGYYMIAKAVRSGNPTSSVKEKSRRFTTIIPTAQ